MTSRTIRAANENIRPLELAKNREVLLFVVTVIMFLIMVIRAPEYLASNSITNLLINWGLLGTLALGQLPVLLTRGIDLSQASVLAFTGMFLAILSQRFPDLPAGAFLILAIGMGAIIGLINGIAVAFIRIPPIITTLATMPIIRGLIFVLSKGAWISSHEMSENFKGFPEGSLAFLPHIFLVMLLVGLFYWYFLTFTRTGRNVYAYGGNPVAARFAGISRTRVELLVYILSGVSAGLVGYLWTGRFAIAYTQAAQGREFAIVAACVIGGVSIAGGRGSVGGVILGAIFISILETALPFLRINPFLQLAVIGAAILISVAVNARAEQQPGRQILPRSEVQEGI
jgi:rhamnose transport system permease protein